MTRQTLQNKARRKLLKLLTVGQLEQISARERPWLANRATLEAEQLANWQRDAEELQEAIDGVLKTAGLKGSG
jgi:hypothetical protein